MDAPRKVERKDERKLGRLLLDEGLITEAQLEVGLREQTQTGLYLGRILIDQGVIDEAALVKALATQLGLQFIDLLDVTVDASAVTRVPEAVARKHNALPIAWDGAVLVVAIADPANVLAIDDLRSAARAPVRLVVATPGALESAINQHHRLAADVDDVAAMAIDDSSADAELSELREITDDAPIVKLANLLIRQAVQDRASDIHIEPTERDVRVRYRVDGVLHEVMRSPKQVQNGLVSRLKIMAELNIAEKRVPQDGRVSATIAGRQIDLRVATLPTVYGEKVVMRILDKGTALLELEELGFLPESLERYRKITKLPWGTILVTGPTGSGKSTTLYSTLNQISDPTKNIITIEDPVEYRLAGINQVQVNPKAGLTFAVALRSILRSDPDIVLVGEIRDRETATIAMEAALTGHLVLTTLHTNDSASTPSRLTEMGLEPYLISSSISCIVAQRLIRRLCERCKEAYVPSVADLDALGYTGPSAAGYGGHTPSKFLGPEPSRLYKAVGCQACSRTGYLGRFAVYEVLVVSEEIRGMIAERASTDDIRKVAVAEGMLTLRDGGVINVCKGITTVEELLRVIS